MNMNTNQTTITAVDASLASFKESTEALQRGKQLAVEALQNHPREAVTNSDLMNHVLGMIVDAADEDYSRERVIDPYDSLKAALESCFSRELHPYANIRAHSFSVNLHLTFADPSSEAGFISDAEKHGQMIDALLKAFDAGIFDFKLTFSSEHRAGTRKIALSSEGEVEMSSWEPHDRPSAGFRHAMFADSSAEAIRHGLSFTKDA